MEENELNTETAQPFVQEWLDNGAEISEGFRLYLENGEWNPKIYARMVKYCRQNGCQIADMRPEYFEVAAGAEETAAEKAAKVRAKRDKYLEETLAKADRYEKQMAADLPPTDSAETYRKCLLYLEYLRNIPEEIGFPDVEVLDFESWKAKYND